MALSKKKEIQRILLMVGYASMVEQFIKSEEGSRHQALLGQFILDVNNVAPEIGKGVDAKVEKIVQELTIAKLIEEENTNGIGNNTDTGTIEDSISE